jgi:2-methylcitrate dehydratase PrpD
MCAAKTYTDKIVDFTLNTAYEDIPPEALAEARKASFDCIGVTLAGAVDPAGQIPADWARANAGKPIASVWGHGFKTSPDAAAMVNGSAAHALDYDDVTWPLVGHPSVSLVPTVIALGEMTGAPGRDVLAAYAIGFEVMTKIGKSIQPLHSLRARWHATGTVGSMGCCAAAGRLLGLDADQLEMALGICSSMTSGHVGNFGTMTKPLHGGLAARNGIQSAQLAGLGFTAARDTIGGHVKFNEVFAKDLPCDMSGYDDLGKQWDLIDWGVVIKFHPCCVSAHTGIDAAKLLREEEGVGLDDIEKIDIGVVEYTMDKLSYDKPETGYQGKFSMTYTVARMIQDGVLKLDSFTDEAVNDPVIQAFLPKVRMIHDEVAEKAWKVGCRPADMQATLKDGRTVQKVVKISKGNKEVPLTPEELQAKFRDCAAKVLKDGEIDQAIDLIENIEGLNSVENLAGVLGG